MQESKLKNETSLEQQGKILYSEIDTLISKRLSVENNAKLSQLELKTPSSAVLFIYNFQLREFRFVLYI